MILPYKSIDIIFNHKNVWANLQNPDPGCILYHIFNEIQWMPLITDLKVEHPLIKKENEEKKKDKPDEDKQTQEDVTEKKKKKKKKKKKNKEPTA